PTATVHKRRRTAITPRTSRETACATPSCCSSNACDPCSLSTTGHWSENDTGPENSCRIQRILDLTVQRHCLIAQVLREPGLLEPTNAVLPGDRSPQCDSQVHHLTERIVRALALSFVVGVLDDEGMGVAVTRVRHHGYGDVLLLGDCGDPAHQLPQLG